jgi:Leucine-rich repeat (LRR) protein
VSVCFLAGFEHKVSEDLAQVHFAAGFGEAVASKWRNNQMRMINNGETAYLAVAVVLLLLLSLTLTVSASASGPDVLFSDPALEQAVREVLGKPSGPVSPDDLRSITELSARELGITDLTGLEYLVNLASLNLSGNKIEDLTPLQSLTGLKYLVLDANQITDISALSGLTNIEWLSLEQNAISDISPLSSLMGMQYLAVTGNSIKDVSPLAGLQNLAVLRLAANEISELRFGVLPSLYYLDLAGNKALVLIFTTEKGEM